MLSSVSVRVPLLFVLRVSRARVCPRPHGPPLGLSSARGGVLTSRPLDPEREDAAFRRTLLLLTLAGLVARAALLVLEPETSPVADERTWTEWARIVAERPSPFAHKMIFHPPLYPYFLAGPYALTGSFAAAQALQIVIAALLIPAVGRVGALTLGREAGIAAAAIAALYPELVWFSCHFWVENIFLVLLWWAFERLLTADRDGRGRDAVAAGVLWGAAVLARETALYFLPVAAAWLALRRGRGGPVRAGVVLAAAVLTIAPWTYRNWIAFDAFVPVSTAGGQNLFQGNARIPRDETYRMVDEVQGRIEQYRYARGMGLAAIRERQPAWIFEKLAEQMPLFWEAESMALIHVKRGAYGKVRPAAALALSAVMLLPYLAVLVLAVRGLVTVPAVARPAAAPPVRRVLQRDPRRRPRIQPLPAAGDAGAVPARGVGMAAGRRRRRAHADPPRAGAGRRRGALRVGPPESGRAVAALRLRARRAARRCGGGMPVAMRKWVLLLLAVALGALVRGPFWIEALRTPVDGDTAIIGLMARHLGRGTTMWGQPYGSPVEAWVAAPFFALLGSSAATLRAVYFALGLALIPAAWALGRALDPRAAPARRGPRGLPGAVPAADRRAAAADVSGGPAALRGRADPRHTRRRARPALGGPARRLGHRRRPSRCGRTS